MFDEKILAKLKNYLDSVNYHLVLTMLLGEEIYYLNPLPDYKYVKQNLLKVSPKLRSIIAFFLLGEPIDKSVLDNELGRDLISYLYETEIINRDENSYWLNNFCLTSYCNCYVLVSNVYYYPTCQSREQKPYIGMDSYWLSRVIVNRLSGKVLDLCTGSGIQAILAAKTAEEVVAVDIDLESTRIAKFNVCLNGLSRKIKVLNGDLYTVLNGEKFDYIISNPPFIPIPQNIDFHVCGDGGEDGMAIIRRIIGGYRDHLTPNGEAIMIGQCVGTYDHALIKDVVEEENQHKGYTLFLQKRLMLEIQATGFANLAKLYNGKDVSSEEWLKIYRKMGMTHLHSFTLFTTMKEGKSVVVQIDDTWSNEMIPVASFSSIKEISKNFSVMNKRKQAIVVDEEVAVFLNMIDGKTKLAELLEKMPIKYRLKYGHDNVLNMQNKYASLCSQFERQSIIDRANLEQDNK